MKIRTLTKLRFPDVGDPLSDLAIRRRRVSGQVSLRELEAEGYLKKLRELSDSELDNKYQTASDALQAEADRKEAERPFNQPIARANFSHWAKMSYWTPDEAIALSLGRNPKVANWPAVQQLVSVSKFASEYAGRREIVMRAKAMGQLWDFTIPTMFLAWAERMEFSLPADLVEAVKLLGNQVADWKSLYEQQKPLVDAAEKQVRELQELYAESSRKHSAFMREMSERQDKLVAGYISMLDQHASKIEELQSEIDQLRNEKPASVGELGVRERDSLLRLTIGMAIGGYGHDPKAKRTDTVSLVATDLQQVGLSLSDDTIRKYLAEGRELLPRDQTE